MEDYRYFLQLIKSLTVRVNWLLLEDITNLSQIELGYNLKYVDE